jgi:hypothetical protein
MSDKYIIKEGFKIREVPYPYSSMLAICSDLDETPSKEIYLEIMRFLNTEEQTTMGVGVGLEIGNTIYFDMPKGQFSYWNTDNEGRRYVAKLIESGHIDCIHSFGDYAVTREHVIKDLTELYKLKKRIKVWVDHAQAITNIGPDIMKGEGDLVGSKAYHADLTIGEYGVKYVWIGRVTSIFGQNTKRTYAHLFNRNEIIQSTVTILKEISKIILGKFGKTKYSFHAKNSLMRDIRLRNGLDVIEFIRSNPYWGGVSRCEHASGIPEVVNEKNLEKLVKNGGKSILYTHLGKIVDYSVPFQKEVVDSFFLLKSYVKNKRILVTTTSRLLDYEYMIHKVKVALDVTKKTISIHWVGGLDELQGLTLAINGDVKEYTLIINGEQSTAFAVNQLGNIGFVTIEWQNLKYPLRSA